jgi:hypothetical protein
MICPFPTGRGEHMTQEELRVRNDLANLARSARGRELLQLSLRSIERGERELTAGCWTDRGIAGCLFQHAYWQGVDEGIFADAGRPGDWVGSFVGSGDYGIVIRAIESFDLLAKAQYADVTPRALLPPRIEVRKDEWRTAVERVVVETLAAAGSPPIALGEEVGAAS